MEREDLELVKEKAKQLDAILPALDADVWVVYCREGSDPAAPLLVGQPMVGEAAFLFFPGGEKIAVVANYDQMAMEELGVFSRIEAYGMEGIEPQLAKCLAPFRKGRIALNVSEADHLCDGLTAGMHAKLRRLLQERGSGEPCLVSSENVLGALRAKKTAHELARIREAVRITERIFDEIEGYACSGMTELDVAQFIRLKQRDAGVSGVGEFGASVCSGRVGVGHRTPGDHPLVPGDVLIVDMGVFYRGYCSDITRTFYIPLAGERQPPDDYCRLFSASRDALHKAVDAMAPGIEGHEVDAVARAHLSACDVDVYPNALGHQIGRFVHDGFGLLAPLVPRYGARGNFVLEEGHVFTVEPFIYNKTEQDGAPPIGVEEDVVIQDLGAVYLSKPQMELRVLRG